MRAWHSNWIVKVLQLPLRAYQIFLSPLLGSHCRFYPTCSAYALEALRTHGPLRGTGLSLWRILRCGPWSRGGYDPVPESEKHG